MMSANVEKYISSITSKYYHEGTSEMGYRADLEVLLKEIFEGFSNSRVAHDPKAVQGNKPDFIVLKNEIPILYIEAKDVGVSLDKIEKSEQATRYFGYANLVITDYVEFRFYRNGLAYGEPIQIAKYNGNNRSIKPYPENFANLVQTLADFTKSFKEPIRSGTHLSKVMGGKAQRIRDTVIHLFEDKSEASSDLRKLYDTIKTLLVHDLTIHTFADMYAQTMVYGLFVARYNDKTKENFNRSEARELIPNSNKLLQRFFDHIVGIEFKNSLKYIVDELCEVFSHADVEKLLDDYFKTSKGDSDPVIHFYEDFLNEYDPVLRKKMGAYYTPKPVVDFIVRSVDRLLKEDMNLISGLADTSKLPSGKHRVQVLDPATGTGTFISSIVGLIHETIEKSNQGGSWFSYIHNDLLPRIHGFELMMAPYTIAHLRLGIEFRKMGFWDFHRRLGIYLTNTLEESSRDMLPMAFGLAESIAEESKEAATIKNDVPIMVVIGNPPYSISSSNKGEWIQNLIKVYKNGLNEQNINSLSDDYVKFIRLSEYFIEKNGNGIVALITNNSFLDGITHRQMRRHLLETFDDVYILDLHGNSKKKETSPDGTKDENVFDIQQGVSINIFVRKSAEKTNLGKLHHSDLYGKRSSKFDVLNKNSLKSIKWKDLGYSEPYFFFVPKDFSKEEEYCNGFKIDELFVKNGSGIKFRKDNLLVKNHFSQESVERLLQDMNCLDDASMYHKYGFTDTLDWKLSEKRALFEVGDCNNIQRVLYRPFDIRYTYYPLDRINKIIPRGDSRKELMRHFIRNNYGLIFTRSNRQLSLGYVFVANILLDLHILDSAADSTVVAPLYLYDIDGIKIPNLKREIVDKIEDAVGKVTPEDVFDYIYAVLHSTNYRTKYKEFLKIDFPRIPFPSDKIRFQKYVKLGLDLRSLHLLESPGLNKLITTYAIAGSDIIEKIEYKDGNVYINSDQYFGNISQFAWNFWIGGYQPAQKWLKDRKGKQLNNEEVVHYQKIISALIETDKIIKEIDDLDGTLL